MKGYYTGRVSSVDLKHGFVKVTYPQENNIVSDWLPLLAFEYNMPEVDSIVATLLDDNFSGVCLGKINTYSQMPDSSGCYTKNIDGIKITKKGNMFRIDFNDGAAINYDGNTLHIKAKNIVLEGYKGVS